MPLTHITAALSNAVLVAIMPQVSDFSKKLDLPLPQPIPLNQVVLLRQVPRKDSKIMCNVTVTNESNKFTFEYTDGCVSGFKMDHIPFLDDDPAHDWASYAFGDNNMTTNAAIEMARDSLKKLGLDPKDFHADLPPTLFQGDYYLRDGNHVPFAKIEWQSPDAKNLEEQQNGYFLQFFINMNKKTLIGMTIITRKIWRNEPKIEIPPQPQIQGKWSVRTNAPSKSVQ
jgi:hypothetical protein